MAKSEPEFIVLDSNAIIADYWLRSPSFVLLQEFLKKTGAALVVPQVVLEEVINHHREELETVKSEMQATHRKATRLFRSFPRVSGHMVALNKSRFRDPYDRFLPAELKNRFGAQIIDYQDIPHREVVARDLKRTRPFQQSGRGYRDALIWETVIRNCIKAGVVTAFITDNTLDFCDPKGGLHEDLCKDIRAKRANDQDFKLYKDLIQFTDSLVVPFLETRKEFATLIANKKVPGLDLEGVCEGNRDTIIRAIEQSPNSMIRNPGKYEPSVRDIAIPHEFEIISAMQISQANRLLVAFKVRIMVVFSYFLPQSEYASMTEEEIRQIDVLNAEWNEYVMQVVTFCEVDLKCRLTFDTKMGEVESFEVEDVKGVEKES